MNWHLYKKDDPNTWPQIDCPMVVYKEYGPKNITTIVCVWDKQRSAFYEEEDHHYYNFNECYYARITHVPSVYKTHETIKCGDDGSLRCSGEDDGYCMYDHCECKQQRKVNEYAVELKRVWREFP